MKTNTATITSKSTSDKSSYAASKYIDPFIITLYPKNSTFEDAFLAANSPFTEEELKIKEKIATTLESQQIVGLHYLFGDEIKKNEEKAYKWFLKAAESGHSPACITIGIFYARGKHPVEKNIELAQKWLLKALELKNAKAHIELGCLYAGWFNKDKEGNPQVINQEKAIIHLEEAAKHNIIRGHYYLALFQKDVLGEEQKSLATLKNGASKGCIKCQQEMGYLYMADEEDQWITVVKNNEVAKFWLSLAAEQNSTWAMEALAHIENNPKLAKSFLKKASELGSTEANIKLAKILLQEKNTANEQKEGFLYLEKAKEKLSELEAEAKKEYGNEEQKNLYDIYKLLHRTYALGLGTEINKVEGKYWGNKLDKSDRVGHPDQPSHFKTLFATSIIGSNELSIEELLDKDNQILNPKEIWEKKEELQAESDKNKHPTNKEVENFQSRWEKAVEFRKEFRKKYNESDIARRWRITSLMLNPIDNYIDIKEKNPIIGLIAKTETLEELLTRENWITEPKIQPQEIKEDVNMDVEGGCEWGWDGDEIEKYPLDDESPAPKNTEGDFEKIQKYVEKAKEYPKN